MKPSWTDIAAFGLLLFFALVMANGWPSGDWALGWSAIGAVGTVVTGGIAARIAYVQHRDSLLAAIERQQAAKEGVVKRLFLLEIRIRHLSDAAVTTVNALSSANPSWVWIARDALNTFLFDRQSWPSLEFPTDDEAVLVKADRDSLHDLRRAFKHLLDEYVGFEPTIKASSTPAELLVAIEGTLLRAQVVASISESIAAGEARRHAASSAIEEALIVIRRVGMLYPEYATARQQLQW
ncbi:hypothetical protein AFAE65S_02870 [Alcaligenes phenolicus]